jgi:hypothetical protein
MSVIHRAQHPGPKKIRQFPCIDLIGLRSFPQQLVSTPGRE